MPRIIVLFPIWAALAVFSAAAPVPRAQAMDAPAIHAPAAAPGPLVAVRYRYGGYGYHAGFGHGMMGGMLGFGIARSLFGHRGYGGSGGGLGFIGLLIRLAILFFLVRFLYRFFTRRRAGGSFMAPRYAGPQPAPPVEIIQPADYQAFEVLLNNVQAAWSNQDLAALRQFATEPMASRFAAQLQDNAARGRHNMVTDLRLQKGDVTSAWQSGGHEHATVALQYTVLDATYDPAGHLIDGSASEHVTHAELWTFERVPGRQWLLSAVEAARI